VCEPWNTLFWRGYELLLLVAGWRCRFLKDSVPGAFLNQLGSNPCDLSILSITAPPLFRHSFQRMTQPPEKKGSEFSSSSFLKRLEKRDELEVLQVRPERGFAVSDSDDPNSSSTRHCAASDSFSIVLAADRDRCIAEQPLDSEIEAMTVNRIRYKLRRSSKLEAARYCFEIVD
jgi:hypothetical protein